MRTYLQILLFLVFPVLLLALGLVPLNQRGTVLVVVIAATVLLSFLERIPAKELGIRTNNFKKTLAPYTIFTLIGVGGLFLLSQLFYKSPLPNWWTYSHLQWAFLPISAVQEFVYRAFYQTKLQKLISPWKAILVTTLLYSGMHILWKGPLILAMTFGGGLAWGYLWYKYPNFYLITLSHTVLNFLAIYLGFFPWLVTEFFNLK